MSTHTTNERAYNYKTGLGNSAAYQVSGAPYVTGAIDALGITVVRFPKVTSWVSLSNVGNATLFFGFSREGVGELGVPGARSFALPVASTSPVYDLKVTEIWLSGSNSVTVMAGLTTIGLESVNNPSHSPSGSNWSGSLDAQV